MEIKKKQHYVSQFYLQQWSECGERVSALINGKVVPMRIKEIAASNYFYKVTSMNRRTKEILSFNLSKLKSPHAKNTIEFAINCIDTLENLKDEIVINNSNLKKSDNAIRTNIIEDYYKVLEDLAAPVIRSLIKGELLNHNDYQAILRFTVNQLSRTPSVKNKFKKAASNLLKEKGIDFQAYYSFQTLIISEEIVLYLIENLYKVTLIENESEINFITSDNPAFNINPISIKDMKIFLPLSPKKAIYIEPTTFNEKRSSEIKENYLSGVHDSIYYFDNIKVSEIDVYLLNKRVSENKERSIFGFCPEDLHCMQ